MPYELGDDKIIWCKKCQANRQFVYKELTITGDIRIYALGWQCTVCNHKIEVEKVR